MIRKPKNDSYFPDTIVVLMYSGGIHFVEDAVASPAIGTSTCMWLPKGRLHKGDDEEHC
jgi:hypothetical protein